MDEIKKLHVLLIYRSLIPSIRLCGHYQLEELMRQGKLEYRACQEMHINNMDLDWADIVLLGRLDNWYELQLAKRLREAGRYLVYILDDDLLNIPSTMSSAQYYKRGVIQKCIREMIEISDAIISPSPFLLRKYATNGRRAIRIEEPAVDIVSYQKHDLCKPVKIGIAGSIDRTNDIEQILEDVLIEIKREYGERVQIEFFGSCPSFAKQINAKCHPYVTSYTEYRQKLNNMDWDIGLAPMPETEFHQCKHYIKYIEYAASGVMCLCSDVQPYVRLKGIIDHRLFVPNEKQCWKMRLKQFIEDDALRENMRKAANHHAHSIFCITEIADKMCGVMYECKDDNIRKKVRGHLLGIKVIGCMKRGIWFIQKKKIMITQRILNKKQKEEAERK